MEVQLTDEEVKDVVARLKEHVASHKETDESSYICDEDCWAITVGIIINDVLREKYANATTWIPIERQRMSKGKCPRCGFIPEVHHPDFEGWTSPCTLSVVEVAAKLESYQRELRTEDGRRTY